MLQQHSPNAHVCFVSGAGTDSTEQGRSMWARVKGRTENALLAMPFTSVTVFRPAFIKATSGNGPQERWLKFAYVLFNVVNPILRGLGMATSTTEMGTAMLNAGRGRSTCLKAKTSMS